MHGGHTDTNQFVVINVWAKREPYAVLDLVDSWPKRLAIAGEHMAFAGIAKESPAAALDYLKRVEEPEQQTKLALSLAQNWVKEDPRSTLEWLLSREDRINTEYVIANTAGQLAVEDPEQALRISATQSGDLGRRIHTMVLTFVARTDVDRAIDLLPGVRESSRYAGAYAIGRELLKSNPARAFSLAGTMHTRWRDSYHELLLKSWVLSDSYSLLTNIDELPTHDIKSKAAQMLVEKHRRRGTLTERQLDDLYARMDTEDTVTVKSFPEKER